MAQVSLNTRISPETDKILREFQQLTGGSIATIVNDAILFRVMFTNKELVEKHTGKEIKL